MKTSTLPQQGYPSAPPTNVAEVRPIVSINRHGYQRTTIQARDTLYPLNLRIDKLSHDNLRDIKAYYDLITGLRVKPSVIMRRAIQILADHIRTADVQIEQTAIVECSHMEETHA